MSAPCAARSARNAGSPGAIARSAVGTTMAAAEPIITRTRPARSESGP